MRPYKVGQQVYVEASNIMFGEDLKIVDGKCKVMGYDEDGWVLLEVKEGRKRRYVGDGGLCIAPQEMQYLKPEGA